jgi:microcystin-dependent protein
MAHNFQRPGLPYDNESLQNDKRYQIITRSDERPATDVMIDTDFNYVIDGLRQLDIDIAGVVKGILPGSDNPDNANLLPTTDGAGNISWIDISDVNIRDNSVTGSRLFSQAITVRELGDGSVTTPKLATNSVTTIKVLDFNITANKLAVDSVLTDKIVDLNVTAEKLAADSVTTDKIVDLNVTTAKIADANVTLAKLSPDTLAFMNALMPIGLSMRWNGAGAPTSIDNFIEWKEENGQLLNRIAYASLFAIIGTTYGAGDGSTTFALPDSRGRVAVGIGSDNSTGGLITSATAASITLGATFGSQTHTLTLPQIPSHVHRTKQVLNSSAPGGNLYPTPSNVDSYEGAQIDTDTTGGGLEHNNVQPSMFTRYYIRAL